MGDEFFTLNEPKISKTKSKKSTMTPCEACGLGAKCMNNKVLVSGKGRKGILIVKSETSHNDDSYGYFSVDAGLKRALENRGIIIERDCWVTSAVRCYTASPTDFHVQMCKEKLQSDIKKLAPKIILTIGESAFDSLISYDGRLSSVKNFDSYINRMIPDQNYKIWICPIHSTEYLDSLKDPIPKKERSVFLSKLVNNINISFPIYDWKDKVFTTTNINQAVRWIRWAKKQPIIAFDYETTGLKPHRKEQKIYTISVSDGKVAYSFPMCEELSLEWKEFLESPVYKIAHSFGFEAKWSFNKYGVWPKNWFFDSCLAQHSIRSNTPTGLKFLTYVNFGVAEYDIEIDPFLKASTTDVEKYGANALNTIEDAPIEKLLQYGGADSLFTFKLYEILKDQLTDHQKHGFRFFMRSQETLVKVQENGLRVKTEQILATEKKLLKKLEEYHSAIYSDPILNSWPKDKPFNFASTKDMKKLIYEIYEEPVKNTTKKGSASTDIKTLSGIDKPIFKNILLYKKWHKAVNTYIQQIKREVVDDYIRASINLHIPVTYRSSISDPSLQNIPNRDKEVMENIRNLIIPRDGNKLISYDFKSIEVAVAACYTQDSNLIKYITDTEHTDMHRDSAMDLFFLDAKDVTKAIRHIAKNKYVFPEFYGSYYALIAPDIWETIDTTLKEHLYHQGVTSYKHFENHVRDMENKFWNIRFPEYKQWRYDQWDLYCRQGYIDSFTGFRYHAPMDRKTVVNYPIQGSAFHILLWTMNKVVKELDNFPKSKMILEIHDDEIIDTFPKDEESIDNLVYTYGTQKVREYWDWISVPLLIEKARSKINGSWAKMEECGPLRQNFS